MAATTGRQACKLASAAATPANFAEKVLTTSNIQHSPNGIMHYFAKFFSSDIHFVIRAHRAVAQALDPDNASILVAGGGGVALITTRRLKDMGSWVWVLQRSDSRR